MSVFNDIIAKLSPEQQEKLLQKLQSGKKQPARTLIPVHGRETNIFDLSFAQQRLWFLEQLDPGNTAYLVPHVQSFYGELNARALERSLNELVWRHESLRTTFENRGGQAVQVIHPAGSFLLPVIDLQGLHEALREQQARVLAQQEAHHPCSLAQGPLFRTTLLRLGTREHQLLFTQHHIVTDGWSTLILVRELSSLYTAFVKGEPSPLLPLPVQYADYALWQRHWLQGEVLEGQLRYWREQLTGLEPLALPTDHPRPARLTYQGGREARMIPVELQQALQQVSQQEGVTMFMLLLAAFQVLLARYSGQKDISVGTPIANRTRAEIEGVIGFFVNTLVLRSDLSGNPQFSQVLAQVRATCLQAYTHQDIPFEKVVEELEPERDLNRSPLFQVWFVLQEEEPELGEVQGVRSEALSLEASTSKFDLTLSVVPGSQGLQNVLEYSKDLFEAETIERMLEHWQILLEGLVQDRHAPLSEVALLSQREQEVLLKEWNPVVQKEEGEQRLHCLFEQQVERTPEAIALVYEEQSLTYEQLNRRANQVARMLREGGIGAEERVGIYMPRGLEMVISILAVLKAGGAYVPLDPVYPVERLAFMLSDAHMPIVLTHSSLGESLSLYNVQIIYVDIQERTSASEAEENIDTLVLAEHPAYIIYTSGSTGTPKGVIITHANASRLFTSTQPQFDFNNQDVWTNFHSYAFDFSVWEIWGALLYGGRLVVVSYEVSRTPEAFYALLQAQSVTVLNQTPSAFRQMIHVDNVLASESQIALALRLIIFGGEALDLPSLRPWFERHGDQKPQLVNMYGITETTVHVTYRPLHTQDAHESTGSMIGEAISDLQLYILDEHLHLVPVGVAGELYVGGAGLAYGYLNQPALTSERFIAHPFSSQPGARLYKTGDLARFLREKDVEYLGRIDQQVKIRGFRIELGEIESRIAAYSAVRTCVVIVREDTPGDKRLVAYVVPKDGALFSSSEMRRLLLEVLPDYMVPAIFMLLDELPYTSNGKLDRRALPMPTQVRPELAEEVILPHTPTEEILAGIWSSVLGIDQVGIYDNFFALGGDSIRSIQVLSQARERGIHFSLRQLFQHQTIYDLARAVSAEAYKVHLSENIQAFSMISSQDQQKLPARLEDAYPLTWLQRGMVFHSQYNPDSAVYHDIFSYQLRASLNVQLLHAAIQHLAACHPVLRTAFDLNIASEPLQLVYQTVSIPVQIEDLSHFTPVEQDEKIAAWIETEKKRSFDWEQAPLLNFQIHRRSEMVFQFTLSFHHAILDGWSVASLFTELFENYFSLLKGEKATLKAPPTVQFRDFVALERKFIELEEAKQFWRQKLADSTSTLLPRWRRSEQNTMSVPSVYELPVEISQETSATLKRLAQTLAVPVKSILLATHLRVISFLCGQTDILTGLVSNGRLESTDGERVLGLFLNTLPLRSQLSGGTWIDLIQETFAAECELLSYRWYPLAEIQKHQGKHDLFEVVFNFIHFHVYENIIETQVHKDKMQVLDSSAFEETNFPLTANFSLDLVTLQIRLSLLGRSAELDFEQIEAIGNYYALALSSIANEPYNHYALQPLLSKREREQLIEWNATQRIAPDEILLHRIFEKQVQRTPDAIALVFEEYALSYIELDRLANQLAHRLRKLGIGPDDLVGLYVPRSIEMMIGLLGILKAGGAYVPLDPSSPTARLQWIVRESHLRVVLTRNEAPLWLTRAGTDCQFLDLDGQQQWWQSEPTSQVQTPLSAQNLAYLLYTSGSTGHPKGVLCSHGAVGNHLLWICETMNLGKHDRVLQKAPLTFDASVTECFASLTCGGCVVLAQPDGQKDPSYLVEIVARENISVVQFVPSLLRLWVEEAGIERCTGLRSIISAGEVLSADLQASCFQRCPAGVQLYNLYGPTEAATDVSYWVCQRRDKEHSDTSIPIGYPITNIQIHILDQYLQPLPIGGVGDVYLAGIGLARGYFQQPDLTADRFIPDPVGEYQGGRLYRTGDLGRRRADGAIEYIGRVDEQVKLRGIRIELGEIEAVLGSHPQVRERAVIVREGQTGTQQLVAYVVATPPFSAQEVRQYMREQLPEYMVPTQVVLVDALPLMMNGKVDRKALPDPGPVSSQDDTTFSVPRTAVEKELTTIWADVLHLERVGIRDNFFELGGDSIMSIQIIARARQKGLRVTLKQLFQYPTIEELSSMIDVGTFVQAEQGLVLGSVPLTPIQQWFFDLQLPMQEHWNQAMFFEVAERLYASHIEDVVRAWILHHDALRLRFVSSHGTWHQHIAEYEEDQSFLVVDLSSVVEHEQKDLATQLAAQTQTSLDIVQGPLLRVILFDMGKEKAQCLLIIIHHLAIDGVSWRILLEDLQTAYQQLKQGRAIELPAKTSSFKAWAESLVEYARSSTIQQKQAYWLTRNIAPIQPLPLDFPVLDQVNTVASVRTVSVSLSEEETKALLEEVPVVYHTQVNDILMTALARTLAEWTGSSSALIDLEGHGREDLFSNRDVSRTVGWFTSMFPVHIDFAGTSSLEEVIDTIKEQLGAIPDHGIGYGILRYLSSDVALVEKLRAFPQAEVAFNYLGQFNQAHSIFLVNNASHLSSGLVRSLQGRRTHLLDINCYVNENQFQLTWSYSEHFHRPATIEQLATAFMRTLRTIISHGQTMTGAGYTPANFPNIELSQEQLDQIALEMDFG